MTRALFNRDMAISAAFFLLLREGVSRYFTEYYLIPVGIIFTAMVIFMPQGLLGLARKSMKKADRRTE